MAKATKTEETTQISQEELLALEQRKIKALEKIANSLDISFIFVVTGLTVSKISLISFCLQDSRCLDKLFF